MSQQSSPHSKAKSISGKLVTSGISDVAIVSVHSEKTRLKKMIMIIIIISMNKSQLRIDGFWRVPEIDFRCELKARKVMVDFKFDALYN